MDKKYRQELKWKNKSNIEEAVQRKENAERNLRHCKFDLHFWKIRLNKLRRERKRL